MITPEEARDKIENGHLKFWMLFEVLAVSEQVTKESLEKMIRDFESDTRVGLYKKSFTDPAKREDPFPNIPDIKVAYFASCEIEGVVKSLEDLARMVMEFGPSAVEVLEPANLRLTAREAQNILSTIAEIMHKFAAAGAGGLVFLNK